MKDFHKLCDNKGPTLTLFLLPTNRICAGFTSESWETGFGKYKSDSKSLLFSFDVAVTATATVTSTPTPTSYKVFPVKNPEKAIFCRNDYGPCFGDNELSASYEPMNGQNNGRCKANEKAFCVGKDGYGERNTLTGSESEKFTSVEIECYELKY